MRYDCIVIGARCAGAPLARFLARGGARVLLCDAAAMPSDQPMSTHFIQPYGMTIVDELGLGDRVRAVAPPVDYNNPLNQMVFAKMASRPDLQGRIREVVNRTVSPFDAFSTGQVIGWTLTALLCGRFGVLGPFFAAGKRTAKVKKELAARVQLARAALPSGATA